MLFILFLTLAALGGAVVGVFGSARYWRLGGARAALIGFKAQLETAYNQGADDALTVVEAQLEARR